MPTCDKPRVSTQGAVLPITHRSSARAERLAEIRADIVRRVGPLCEAMEPASREALFDHMAAMQECSERNGTWPTRQE